MPSLDIEPKSELKFKGPFNDIVTSEIIATNNSSKMVCFKVKTTAPKQYCVRPNCGYVEPGQTVIITIMLQPIDLTSNEKLKHKFLIQSLELTPPYPDNPELVWKTANHEEIGEHKLKCVFDVESTDEKAEKKGQYADVVKRGHQQQDDIRKQTQVKPQHQQQPVQLKPASKLPSLVTALLVVVISIVLGVIVGKFVME